jgi:hypothetical protein
MVAGKEVPVFPFQATRMTAEAAHKIAASFDERLEHVRADSIPQSANSVVRPTAYDELAKQSLYSPKR